MKRVAQVIRVKPEAYDAYVEYHRNVWPGVAKQISDCNIRNYSIYHYNGVLFAYFEYVGEDFDGDMAKMAADPETQRWWDTVKPLQEPVDDRRPGEWWHDVEEVFHQE
jgi:L-rhamnose mutarotase